MSFQLSKLSTSIKYALVVGLLSVPLSSQAMTNEEADLNGDGQVNFLDIYAVITRLGVERGMPRYRESLDIDNDGIISFSDYFALFGNYGQDASILNTSFSGQVVDNQSPPNPIKGVRVELENSGMEDCTDEFGRFTMPVSASDFGENLVTFDGSILNGCGLTDATPGTLSGEYPTIPHKPIYINGGTNNEFRLMSLPERDLTGAVEVAASATNNGGNSFTLTQETVVDNAGVELAFTDGCTIQFPDGETPRLSITEVDPGLLPVAPPPGQGSSLFVTFQPGGSQVTGADCTNVVVIFDNSDMMANAADPNSADQPGLRGVVDGTFQELTKVFAGDLVGGTFENADTGDNSAPLLRGEIPVPFDFAWYAVTVPANPCPLTTVTGQVLLNNPAMDPVANAKVTIGGVGPVFTDAAGQYTFVNVPAGPNGPRCNSSPFNIAAAASKDLNLSGALTFNELGGSGAIPAVPGGTTDMGVIKLGLTGVVQGEVRKLNSIDPFMSIPLPLTQMELNPQAAIIIPGQTTTAGVYRLENVPTGQFDLTADFSGLLPLPSGGEAFKEFFGSHSGQITFQGQVVSKDFKFLGHGEIELEIKDPDDLPLPDIGVQLFAFGGNFSGFQAGSMFCFNETDNNGVAEFNQDTCGETIPMGPCEINVFDQFGGEYGFFNELHIGPEDGCFINEHGQVLLLQEIFDQQALPGDITLASFSPSFHRPLGGNPDGSDDIPTFAIEVEFTQPYNFEDTFVELHLDLDQDQTTGFNSNSGPSTRNVISGNPGADIRIICYDDLIFGDLDLRFDQCMGVDKFDEAIPGLEQIAFENLANGPFESLGQMVLLIPRQPIIDFANGMPAGGFGDGPWDVVLEVGIDAFGYGGDGEGGIIFDMVPNTDFGADPFEVFPSSPNSIVDPTEDFFFNGFFFD